MRRVVLLCGMASFGMGFLGSVLALILAAPAVAGAQATRIQAEQFYIADADGRDRIILRTEPGISAGVGVADTNGMQRVFMAIGGSRARGGMVPEAAGFNVNASDGTQIVRLGTGPFEPAGDGTNLVLSDRQGRSRVVLVVSSDGTPSIQMLDADGNLTWSAR